MGLNGSPSLLAMYVDLATSMSAAYPERNKRGRGLLMEQRSHKYPGTAMLMRGGGIEKRIKRGMRIESPISLTIQGDFGQMTPGEDWTWGSSDGHEYLVSHWRKYKATESIDDDELEERIGSAVWDAESMAASLVDVERLKKGNLWTKTCETTENYLWANPYGASDMEDPTGRPRSLLSFVNEYQTGHGENAVSQAVDGVPPDWSTQHSLDPSAFVSTDGTRSLLSCQQFSYLSAASSVTTADHLIDVLDEALSETKFEAVPMAESFNEESSLYGAPGIFTSRKGKSLWNRTLRAHGEFFAASANRNDPVQRGVFDGISVIDVPALKNAAIYPKYSGTTLSTATTFGAGETGFAETDTNTLLGSRFFIFNPMYINRYIKRGKDYKFRDWYALDQTNPEKYVCYLRLDDALHVESFQRQACVHPGQDITGF